MTFDAKDKKSQDLILHLDDDGLTLRASKLEMKVDIPPINVAGRPYSYTGIGITIDRDNVVAQAEAVQPR